MDLLLSLQANLPHSASTYPYISLNGVYIILILNNAKIYKEIRNLFVQG